MRSRGLQVKSLSRISYISGPSLSFHHQDKENHSEDIIVLRFKHALQLLRAIVEVLYTLAARKQIEVRPRVLIGGATHRPDLFELVQVRVTAQYRSAVVHLAEHAARVDMMNVR